jgi:hypothetical protein
VKRDWLLYLVIFSLALNFGTIGTFAYLRYEDKGQIISRELPPPIPMRALWSALHLDDSQRQALYGLLPQHRGKVAETRAALFQKRQELFDLLKGEAPAMDAVQSKIEEISALQGKLEEEEVRFILEFRKHLKPEQNAAFLELVQTRLHLALGGPWGGRPGGPGPWRGPRMGPLMGPGPHMGPGPGTGAAPGGPKAPD